MTTLAHDAGVSEEHAVPVPLSHYGTKTVSLHTGLQNPLPSLYSQQIIDAGNAPSRYLRLTMYKMPQTSSLLKSSGVPLGLILQPFADAGPGESPVPLVDPGAAGPQRCARCRAYMNAFNKFSDGGRAYMCSLCGHVNRVAENYFMPLDLRTGKRQDHASRAELSRGVYDVVAPSDLVLKEATPRAVLFVLDVSMNANRRGFVRLFVQSVARVLDRLPEGTRVGFLTYSSTLHFYDLCAELPRPHMLVVADTGEPFIPRAAEALMVEYHQAKAQVTALLELLPSLHPPDTDDRNAALGGALWAAEMLVGSVGGGQVLAFPGTLPLVGAGAVTQRMDPKKLGTKQEKFLLRPKVKFYRELGIRMSKAHVAMHAFVLGDEYVDVATIREACLQTGGELRYYPEINALPGVQRKFARDVERVLVRTIAREIAMRVRVSAGVEVQGYAGAARLDPDENVYVSELTADSAISVDLHLIDRQPDVFTVQVALLYTAPDGQRRIRVLSLSTATTDKLNDVYDHADVEAVVALLCRRQLQRLKKPGIKPARAELIDAMIAILVAYKKKCSTSGQGDSLVMPVPLKLLPLYTLALLKTRAFALSGVLPDARMAHATSLIGCSVPRLLQQLYPRLTRVDNLSTPMQANALGVVQLPPAHRLTRERLQHSAAYVADDGEQLYLWLGRDLPEEYIVALFGSNPFSAGGLAPERLRVPLHDNVHSHNLNIVINALRSAGSKTQSVTVVHPSFLNYSLERFWDTLVEDKTSSQVGYSDFLVKCYTEVKRRV